ncbi:GNAT family N-acetyltransferase [Amycolatopsis dendrobii]|uniref:GNAT family N-acetyltransferase n=1 Tax=Amycolatopsis dendrobii TaxID=2760662 RepID=A0A7W3ZFY2_9PSEU|nr:GNAT family N-acetyltransferase [Amycolatopsis dendrobii]MBB1159960.1 GNAT family N-acetyltransferase [Amycolatopsis dendrobii]
MEIRHNNDYELFFSTVQAAFGRYWPDSAGSGILGAFESERSLIAHAPDGKPVGTAGAYSFDLTLPGDVLASAAGVTAVGVLPTHRRQGVLRAMMQEHLADVRARGEFLSVLLCSEAVIYRRFGYGPATCTERMTVERHRSAFGAPRGGAAVATGSVELLRRVDCGELLEEIYDRYRRTQPGALSRPHRWWALGAGHPPTGPEPRYLVVHRDADGTADGYASYLVNDTALTVDEVIAVDDAAFTSLTQYLLGHDLVTKIDFRHLPPGNPLRWQLADLRAGEPTTTDWLWVRLLDIPRALTSRGWFTDGSLVLDVTDPFLAEHGRYLLTVRDGKAECVRTDRAPDLSLDVSDLGSVYLGGTLPSVLVRAGHVQAHNGEAAGLADALFRSDRAPHCVHWF